MDREKVTLRERKHYLELAILSKSKEGWFSLGTTEAQHSLQFRLA